MAVPDTGLAADKAAGRIEVVDRPVGCTAAVDKAAGHIAADRAVGRTVAVDKAAAVRPVRPAADHIAGTEPAVPDNGRQAYQRAPVVVPVVAPVEASVVDNSLGRPVVRSGQENRQLLLLHRLHSPTDRHERRS